MTRYLPLLFALLLPVATPAAHPVARAFPHEKSDLPVDPDPLWGRLENGIRYVVLRHGEPPGRLSMRLHVDAGSLDEAENQRGLAHFLEHMAFNGTRNFKPEELVELLQSAGIGFGADLNAYTSFDETVYKLDLPKNDADIIGKCFTVLRDWADGMTLDALQIDKERGVILSEKRDRDSVEMRLLEEQFKALLPEALVARRFPIGTEEVISKAPRERFTDFYQSHYTADRMSVIVVGDIDPTETVERIRKNFGSIAAPKEAHPPANLGKVTPSGLMFKAYHDSEVKSTDVGITNAKPYLPAPDTRAERTRQLPVDLANAMLDRRLEILAKKEGSPIVKGDATSDDMLKFVRFTAIDATATDGRWEDALSLIEQEIRRALEHGFTRAELAEATANLLRGFEEGVKTKSTRKSAELANALTKSLKHEEVFTSPETNLAWLKEVLPAITPETCSKALRDVWSGPDRFVTITVKDPLPGAEKAIADVYAKSQAVAVAPPSEGTDLKFAYANVGVPGSIKARQSAGDLGITQWVLSNNIRVNFKPTDFNKNSIEMLVRFGGGKLVMPKDKAGLDMFASAIINSGGLEAHSDDDLQRLFAGKKIGFGFAVDDDAFTLSGKTTREDLGDQLRLICAQLQHPGYRAEAERQLRQSLPILAMQMSTTPEGVLRSRCQRLLKGSDTRFGIEKVEDLGNFTTADVKAWLAPYFKDAAMEVSIVGDFDPAALEPLLLETIGALPARQDAKPDYAAERVIPAVPPGVHRLEYQSKVPKALNLLVWPTEDRSDIKRTRRLGVLGAIFDDRLRVKIREEMGEAYSPNAYSQASDVWKNDGFILCVSPGAPEQSAEVAARILGISAELAAKGATAGELDRALKPMLSGIEQQRRTNKYWLETVLARSQEKPEVLDWARSLEADYKGITLDEVSQLAKTYLPPARATSIFITTPARQEKAPVEKAAPEKKKAA